MAHRPMPTTVKALLSEAVRQGMTPKEVGEAAGVCEGAVRGWINGPKVPNIVAVEKLAAALGLEIKLEKK